VYDHPLWSIILVEDDPEWKRKTGFVLSVLCAIQYVSVSAFWMMRCDGWMDRRVSNHQSVAAQPPLCVKLSVANDTRMIATIRIRKWFLLRWR
jgi:hypothetical protein